MFKRLVQEFLSCSKLYYYKFNRLVYTEMIKIEQLKKEDFSFNHNMCDSGFSIRNSIFY